MWTDIIDLPLSCRTVAGVNVRGDTCNSEVLIVYTGLALEGLQTAATGNNQGRQMFARLLSVVPLQLLTVNKEADMRKMSSSHPHCGGWTTPGLLA